MLAGKGFNEHDVTAADFMAERTSSSETCEKFVKIVVHDSEATTETLREVKSFLRSIPSRSDLTFLWKNTLKELARSSAMS